MSLAFQLSVICKGDGEMIAPFRHRRLGYVALNVTDLSRSTAFATDIFRLSVQGDGPDGARFFRSGVRHHELMLSQAPSAGFLRAAWELETPEQVDRAFHHFDAILELKPQALSAEEKAALGLSTDLAFRVREPTTKACFEYYSRMQNISSPRADAVTKFLGDIHFGLVVPDAKQTVSYMAENIGFVVSDYVGDYLATLMRAFPNPNHHSFAPVQSPDGSCKFHHVAFMVQEIDDIGKLFNRCKRADIGIAFGIGKHPTSGSIHLYIYDPDGMVWEYTLGMEQFPEIGAREPRFMSSRPEDFDLWGAAPDAGFLARGAAVVTE
jgi:2,3-dihydroxy-p-cumate/2,3-dihydroxybenzoate 3,4-dioxygenase